MGVIQSGINQALGIGAALYTQTPGYAAKKEEALKQKELKTSKAQLEALKPELETKLGEDAQPMDELARKKIEEHANVLRERIFDIEPNAANAKEYYGNQTFGKMFNDLGLNDKQVKANGRSFEIVQARAGQKTRCEKGFENNWGRNQTILTDVNKWGETNGK